MTFFEQRKPLFLIFSILLLGLTLLFLKIRVSNPFFGPSARVTITPSAGENKQIDKVKKLGEENYYLKQRLLAVNDFTIQICSEKKEYPDWYVDCGEKLRLKIPSTIDKYKVSFLKNCQSYGPVSYYCYDNEGRQIVDANSDFVVEMVVEEVALSDNREEQSNFQTNNVDLSWCSKSTKKWSERCPYFLVGRDQLYDVYSSGPVGVEVLTLGRFSACDTTFEKEIRFYSSNKQVRINIVVNNTPRMISEMREFFEKREDCNNEWARKPDVAIVFKPDLSKPYATAWLKLAEEIKKTIVFF